MNKILSIIIPIYNKYNFTKSCLNDLNHLASDHEIIVVDNGSTDETYSSLQDNKDIIYLRNETNLGFAKACNIGYAQARADKVLFLNNDIRVKSDHATWTMPLIEKCGDALISPTAGELDNNLNFIRELDMSQYANDVELNNSFSLTKTYLSGWCLAGSKEIFNKLIINDYLGPFSEEFFCYFEDTDLSFRADKLHIKQKLVYLPLIHFKRQSSAQLNTAMLYQQARKIFVKKWQP